MANVIAAVFAVFVYVMATQAEVVIETATVGNPGNTPDTRYSWVGYGGVDYVYNIGKFEITAGQYTEFLNAVAATDTYGLYSTRMRWRLHEYGCNIERSGSSGSYTYSVAGNWADRPVNYVSWGDTARFANWLHNGQPGLDAPVPQDENSTEDGSYFLNGATTDAELMTIEREPDATWVIPSEDEWYKAAYHYNDGVTGNYFDYPTSSDSEPSNELVEPTDPGNNANFYDQDYIEFTIGPPYYRTEIGDFENSESPYGTFDQGGNVWEWNEAILYGELRGVSGGSFGISGVGNYLHASYHCTHMNPTFEAGNFGFRVAEIPEPATGVVMDVKPGSCPNPVNPRSRGVVPMAIVGGDAFDVTQIDVGTLSLRRADGVGGSVAPLLGPPGPGIAIGDAAAPSFDDPCDCHGLGGDGIDDLLLKFSTADLAGAFQLGGLPSGASIMLTLSGSLLDGGTFEASDCVVITGRSARTKERGARKREQVLQRP